jgi:diphthamide biosynthesis protein 2
MALGVIPAWSGRYILDFEKVITEVRDSAAHSDGETTEENDADDADEPHFSLITGKLVTRRRYGDIIEENKGNSDGVLVPRNQDMTVGSVIGSAAGEHAVA